VRPTVLQAVVTFAGGIVLAAGSCAGFLATLNFNRESAVNTAFAIGFVLSLAIAGAGFCLIVIRQVLVMRARRAAALAAPATPSASPATAASPAGQASAGGPVAVADHGTALTPFFVSALLMAMAVACVVLLVVIDPNPFAIVFLALAAAAAVGSLACFAIAAARYSSGRS
jgi:FtsH-binding integral membrane protein